MDRTNSDSIPPTSNVPTSGTTAVSGATPSSLIQDNVGGAIAAGTNSPATGMLTSANTNTNLLDRLQTGTAHKSPLARQVEEGLRAIYTSSNLNDVPENARQMRTAMLDITEAWLDLIEAANGDQTEFYQATLEAVDPEGKEPNTIAFHTAKTIEAAVESADWGLGKADARDALLPAEQQPTNISYCQIFAGMRTVNLEILQQAGAVTSTQGAPPPQIPPREGVLQPSLTNRRPRVTRTAWTDWENDILRQVRADMPDASYPQITQEHNRRVRDARAAERTTMGKDRTATAVRTHMKNVLQI